MSGARRDEPGAFDAMLRTLLEQTREVVGEAERGGQPDLALLVASRQTLVDAVCNSDAPATEAERRLARELAALDSSVIRAIEAQRRAIAEELRRVTAARRALDASSDGGANVIRIATVA